MKNGPNQVVSSMLAAISPLSFSKNGGQGPHHAAGVSNATELHIALCTLGIGPQDNVLFCSYTLACSMSPIVSSLLTQTSARVGATGFSIHSLELLSQWIGRGVKMLVAYMESIIFEVDSFDVVPIAGSRSFWDLELVEAEVKRMLRPDSIQVCSRGARAFMSVERHGQAVL